MKSIPTDQPNESRCPRGTVRVVIDGVVGCQRVLHGALTRCLRVALGPAYYDLDAHGNRDPHAKDKLDNDVLMSHWIDCFFETAGKLLADHLDDEATDPILTASRDRGSEGVG